MARQLKPPTSERGEAEEKVRAALIAGQYREASRIVAEYEAKQAVPRGIGIDWKRYDPNRDVPGLTAIYTSIPAILHGVRDDALPSLRFAAAMKYLWGGFFRRWLDRSLVTGTRFSADTAVRMILFFAWHIRRTEGYTPLPPTGAIVRGVRDDRACPECAAIDGEKFSLAALPELPYPRCTAKHGCRCISALTYS